MSEPLRPQACPQCGGFYGLHTVNCGQAWSAVGEVKEASKLKPEDIVAVIANGIDQAVKAACAQKDQEIERLKKDVNDLNRLLRSVGWGQGEIDSSATIAEESEAKDQRIAELEAEVSNEKFFHESFDNLCKSYSEKLAAMSAILEKVLHLREWRNPGEPISCRKDCPACQWEAMKAQAQQLSEPRSPDAAQKQGAER
jgi:hypothetical protein